jgi:cytochrome c peroxidase
MQFHLSPTGLPTTTQSELSALVGRLSASLTSRDRRDLNAEISANQNVAALGHFVVTLNAADIGTFRTPSLRNVALTAPYMHDGSVANLDDAIELELYGRDASGNSPVILTRHEKDDLVAFLQSLTGSQFNSTK